jgi:hypothetical protein
MRVWVNKKIPLSQIRKWGSLSPLGRGSYGKKLYPTIRFSFFVVL